MAAANSVHTMRWANAMAGRGHEVHLLSQHDPLPAYSRAVVHHRMPHYQGLGYFLNRRRVRRAIQRIKPDVVNAHYASGYGTLARGVDGVPLVINVWGSDVFEFPDRSARHRALLCNNLRHAQAVVSTSEVMARQTKEVCPGLDRVRVVPFGVDLEVFKPRTMRPAGPTIVGTVKTLAPAYGIDVLVKAFALLVQRAGNATDIRLRIVGGGPQRAAIEGLVRELGLTERVDLVGQVPHEQVPDELRKLDVYAALSRSESFGVAVIEASACGLPVVVSDVGGLPEVVKDGSTGFLVPVDDVEAAADRMQQLVSSEELRQRMGNTGREHVRSHYAWEHCVDLQIGVYEEVIASSKRA